MTIAGPTPPTRRSLRETGAVVIIPPAEPPASGAALSWVDPGTVARPQITAAIEASPYVPVAPDLLAKAPRRSPWRPGVLVPFGIVLALIAAYCTTTLLWPLSAIPPQASAVAVQPVAATVATPAWPAQGSAAVAVEGIGGTLSSTGNASPIASITKLVTTLMVLERMPLAAGEQGPAYRMTAADRDAYIGYQDRGESSLDVPVGGSLSELQLLQGTLIGSANNYAQILADSIWANDAVFANAASTWLAAHGLSDMRIVDPTGIEEGNTASPADLVALAQRALANPVIAQIVSTRTIDLPGAGRVENTNQLLQADPAVVGVKTGSLDGIDNLVAAKDVTIGTTPVRLYAVALGQPDAAARTATAQALLNQLATELQQPPALATGTVVGQVTTRWGDTVGIVTGQDASVVEWNGGAPTTSSELTIGDGWKAGDDAGTVTLHGPLNTATVPVQLAAAVDPPSPWWRLTHPLDLFGLV
ncbi:D-alanyl-D-alanine carboxypeptidase [Microbacterium sp. X-17]|uniref:D-alanyl-D-alanine carboxypeptidase family protein n=1 Tax=Microbacterium sp. X-17 TaxID=3144404 RepID=UPI0031F4C721